MAMPVVRSLALVLPLLLAGCGSEQDDAQNLAALDQELIGGANAVDPALASALEDQIMVDPALTQQSNRDSLRPPARAYAAPVPDENVARAAQPKGGDGKLMKAPPPIRGDGTCPDCRRAQGAMTLGALAEREGASCGANIQYSTAWANRLPAAMPLHPQARVVEAAGSDEGGCGLRVVSFSVPGAPEHTLDWYFTRARRAGMTAEHQVDGSDHVLGGTGSGSAYILFLSPRDDGGTDADMVVQQRG